MQLTSTAETRFGKGSIREQIEKEVLAWPEVTAGRHRFGGVEFRVRGRELGHLHGDEMADLPFPRPVRDELVSSGQAQPHHVHPDSGLVSYAITGPEDVPNVLALFRLQYDRLTSDG